jgi:predicted CoA-binding protein
MTVDTGSSMSIRNLDSLFDPRSVAVIGASERPQSVGGTLWRNMRRRFQGRGVPVNPKHTELSGRPCYARVADLPAVPELAVICTPPATVGLIEQLAQAGTQAAVVISAGQTAEQKQAMLDAARPHLLRILGPNCVGLLAPHVGLNASFAHVRRSRADRLRLAVGRAGHRHAGLGTGAAHRLFALRLAGRARRRGLWRHAGLPGQRRAHPRHPAVHRIGRARAQVHVGRAGGGTQQAGHRHQGRAQRAGAEGRGLAHRRAGGADAVYDAPSPAPACCA